MKPSETIEADDLPALGDAAGIFAFAMRFNAYAGAGSFEEAAQAASRRRRVSLEDIGHELFMAARASRHGDSMAYVATYETLLPHFRKFLSS